MTPYLDPLNRSFADAVSQGPPLYEKSFAEAREVLETIQAGSGASDIKVEQIQVATKEGDVTTVIFRPAEFATKTLPVVFYTHGGGWILGR